MNHTAVRTLVFAALAGLTGCASMCDTCINVETDTRNHILAQKAWGEWSWAYDNLDHPVHFARGFKAGYRDVLDGGNGCQPALPPKVYWKPCYQTPDGRCKTYAWFDGFSHGALAAKQDGYEGLGGIPISPRVQQNLRLSRKRREHNMLFDGLDGDSAENTDDFSSGQADPLIPVPGGGSANGTDPVTSPPGTRRPYDE